MEIKFIAHVRKSDKQLQSISEHLYETSALAKLYASKLGIGSAGELLGLLHDIGKYSNNFQAYIRSATEFLNPDEDEDYVDPQENKGKIDHSTAGAQLVWQEFSQQAQAGRITGQILSLCLASHHSGLIDCLAAKPFWDKVNKAYYIDNFTRRISKNTDRTHFNEVIAAADNDVIDRVNVILNDDELLVGMKELMKSIVAGSRDAEIPHFKIGLLTRFLFSCLIDSDRQNSADFEKPRQAALRAQNGCVSWEELAGRLERFMEILKPKLPIDYLRSQISDNCKKAAERNRGIFTLTVPTGGGKTLASLRFALNHARKHELDRVIFVIPFTSIIDQNADVARRALEKKDVLSEAAPLVLEHHSNLGPERQGWKEKTLAETWDAPVVYTTSVQFLEALFGGGTRGARRMHQLARAVIVFDEIQTLPLRCVHIFNNAVNFLVEHCGSSVVLCTATQPLLHKVDAKKGAIKLTEGCEIMPNVGELFTKLKRVEAIDGRKPGGWTNEEVAVRAANEVSEWGSCLVVVNTKKAAREIYRKLEVLNRDGLLHLSASMCPAHRKKILTEIRARLNRGERTLCVATQVIEAGVDVDFGAVIRFTAGLDSIAQASGRCNRNGARSVGRVLIVNPAEENLNFSDDIRVGRGKTERILDEFKNSPESFDGVLIGLKAMEIYYNYYFYDRKAEMAYPVKAGKNGFGRDDTLLNMLGLNDLAVKEYERVKKAKPPIELRQSFETAAAAFKSIDSATQGVIVPYDEEGKEIIGELCAVYEPEKQYKLILRAQQFSVNLFENDFNKLKKANALNKIQKDVEIYYLDERYYSDDFGVSSEPVKEEVMHNV